MLNVVLLAACLGITFVLVLYLFYWNRLVAYIIALAFRFLYWKQCDSSTWLEIGSVHFSLLAGRILFKDIRYHSSNQTIKVIQGEVTWSYWIRNPITQQEVSEACIDGRNEKSFNHVRRCRVQLSLQGYEWFLYNRTASYDSIVSLVAPDVEIYDGPGSTGSDLQGSTNSTSLDRVNFFSGIPGWARIWSGTRKILFGIRRQLPNLDPKSIFPVGLDVNQGSVICGNMSTPNLLLIEFQDAEGTFGVVQSRSKHDIYKQVLNLTFRRVLAQLVNNEGYRGPIADNGELINKRIVPHFPSQSYLSFSTFTRLWNQLGLYLFFHGRSENRFDFQKVFHAKSKANIETPPRVSGMEDSDSDLHPMEYAIDCKILETPVLDITYFVDVVGVVPLQQDQKRSIGLEPFDIGNGDVAPEWGIDIVVRGGSLRYGPWAEHQRTELQRAFFPAVYHDIEPTPFLKPGDKRLWTCMKVFVELRDETNLRIPFREASKNWLWDAEADYLRPSMREPASIQITAGDNSSISYVVPMVAGPMGYEPLIEVHLDTITVSSSLNDIRVVSAESCRFSGILRSPLKWNTEREWSFSVSIRQPVLYLLRDHINMFIDLTRDWISGPPVDYLQFIPMIYVIQLDMHHYEAFLYANDHNIIDKPLINDENALFIFRGSQSRFQIQIPAKTFRPETQTFPFFFEAPDISLDLSLPRWSTHAVHTPKEEKPNLCKASFFRLDGLFHYSVEVRRDFVEQLKMQISARDVECKVFGWAIRYIMVLRDNYIGTFTHFSTLSEYLDKRRKGQPVGDPILEKYRPGMMNVLQVEIELSIANGSLILPAGLPGSESSNYSHVDEEHGTSILFAIPEVQVYLRLHDYFMEMSLNVDTAIGYLDSSHSDRELRSKSRLRNAREMILIDGVDIVANRLFGPQPRTSTYVCFWTIRIGHIRTLLSTIAGRTLIAARNTFMLNFLDPLNAPAAEYLQPIDPDGEAAGVILGPKADDQAVTFLKISVISLEIVWRAGIAALEICCPLGFTVTANDLVGEYHQKLTSLQLSKTTARIFLRGYGDYKAWMEAAVFSGDTYLDIYSSPKPTNRRRTQAEFVQSQDILTSRILWLSQSIASRQSVRPDYPRTSSEIANPEGVSFINGLHLPQTRFFHPEFYNEVSPLISHRFAGPGTPRSRLRSQMSQSSVSEDGRLFPETDRDARLMNLRLTTPAFPLSMNDESASITSGDESDTESLTDACISDDDASILHQNVSYHDYPALSMLYSHSTRHYRATWLQDLLQWDGSPFIPVQVSTDSRGRCDNDMQRCRNLGHNGECPSGTMEMRERHSLARANVSLASPPPVVFRVQCRKALVLNVTPLIVPAAAIFADDIRVNPYSPELSLDAIMNTHLRGLVDDEKATQFFIFEFLASYARICIVHKYPFMTTDPPSILQSAFEDHQRDVISNTEMTLDNFHLTWTETNQSSPSSAGLTISTSFDNLSLMVDVVSSSPSHQQSSDTKTDIFRLTFRHSRGILTRGKLCISCDAILSELDHNTPEHLADIFVKLAQEQRDLSGIYERLEIDNATARGDIIYKILMSSSSKAIVDPLSIIQPSFLVQGGRPIQLRTDPTFKFLFHLRNCLWHLDKLELQTLFLPRESTTGIDERKAMHLLETCLSSLVPDTDRSKTKLTMPGVLFPGLNQINAPCSSTTFQSIQSASVHSRSIEVVFRNPSGRSSSHICLTELLVSASLRTLGLVPFPSHSQVALSQVSSFNREQTNIRYLLCSVLVADITFVVFPPLMTFAQQLLRVNRQKRQTAGNKADSRTADRSNARNSLETLAIHVTSSIDHFQLRAAAENLIFEFQADGAQVAAAVSGSQNISMVSDEIFVRARSPDKFTKLIDQDTLASLVFTGVKGVWLTARDPSANLTARASVITQSLRLDVPRSALRLYRFIEEWRADYLPGIEATLHALLSEIHKGPDTERLATLYESRRFPVFQLHGSIAYLGIYLQVMHGTWLSWNVSRSVAYLESSSNAANHRNFRHFGLQLASQLFSISPSPITFKDIAASTGVKLSLPTLSVAGQYDGSYIETMALVDFFHLKVKPSHWDTLLVVQQKFGQDFNDLMTFVAETRQHQRSSMILRRTADNIPWKLVASMKMRGFRIGLEGLSSIVYLECRDIRGGIDQDAARRWHIQLSDLGLSLASRTAMNMRERFSNRNRLAFVIIDFEISAENQYPWVSHSNTLSILVTKVHAVLQPSSIREAGDFFNQMQSEILERKEQRVHELAAFKEKAKSVMKAFEISIKDTAIEKTRRTWMSRYILNLSIRNVGAAFPLILDPVSQSGNKVLNSVRAFLMSMKSLEFNTLRDEGGQAVMRGFSFQFVSRFRQSIPADFSGESHQTWNRLVYPEIIARLRSHRSGMSRQIRIGANVSGFILDLDSSIPDYIFSLIEVYREGEMQIARWTAVSRNALAASGELQVGPIAGERSVSITSNVFASLTFFSGKVRMYSDTASALSKLRSATYNNYGLSDDQVLDAGAEIFKLPIVSVWGEYRTARISHSELIFKTTVHSSQNSLRPVMLHFLNELVGNMDVHIQRMNSRLPNNRGKPPSHIYQDSSDSMGNKIASAQISFSLRIDQSRLEFTCQPDVNVIARLHWDSGGFVVNISPVTRLVSFTGTVGGLTLGLKHGFLSDDCVQLDARNLAFSMAFSGTDLKTGHPMSSVSVIIDTQFSGGVRFSRLQDVLCFKAVWLDRFPLVSTQHGIREKSHTKSVLVTASDSSVRFSTLFLLRIRQITLDVELGQSIGAIRVDLQDALARTTLSAMFSQFSLHVAKISIVAKGNLSGQVHLPDFIFRTSRRMENANWDVSEHSRMLELMMTSGALDVVLDSDDQRLLQYHASPLYIEIFDDWSLISPNLQLEDQSLRLSFSVTGKEVVAAVTISAFPKLLMHTNKFKANLEAQRDGASRESKTFRVTRSPKPDHPLSAVAHALIHSARNRLKEMEVGLTYVIRQRMSLRLNLLRLVAFPRTMLDPEVVQFLGRDIHARLNRLVELEGRQPETNLHLSISSVVISKFSHLNHLRAPSSESVDCPTWLAQLLETAVEAIIVGLPSMIINMSGQQVIIQATRSLEYDFHSQFVRQEGMRDQDIYITLNMALYSWLTVLRRNLAREMDQVQGPAQRTVTSISHAKPSLHKPTLDLQASSENRVESTTEHPYKLPLPPFSFPNVDHFSTTDIESKISMHDTIAKEYLPSTSKLEYKPRSRQIERLTMRQLGEATPDVMHPFFMKKAGFNLEDFLPQYVHEYATEPLGQIMEILLKIYSKQLPLYDQK